jgi:DNA-binding LacI/PurR family transcriptional regulator
MKVHELEQALLARVEQARHGDKLPPVRALMNEYKVGQALIQEILGRLAHQGKLTLRVGRGTFVQKPSEMARKGIAGASVLVLSLRGQTQRSYEVARRMHAELSRQDVKCVQLVYERLEQALEMLHVKTRFDVCVLQSYFDTIPIGLLSYLQNRCSGVVVDGARISGIDVDAVASDWRGAMDSALSLLRAAGHERIAFLAWPGAVQPLEGLRHHFISLRQCLGRDAEWMPLVQLEHMPRPGESSVDLISEKLAELDLGSATAPSALIVWSVGQAEALEIALARLGIKQRKQRRSVRIVVLGHVNRPEDHLNRFDIIGSNSDVAADVLVQCISARIGSPQSPHKTVYLPNQFVTFQQNPGR